VGVLELVPNGTKPDMQDLLPASWVSSNEYRHGVDLLNQRRYFDAHEVLEDVWRLASGADRQFLQGLIQVAVALHHHSCGNCRGALSVLQRAAANLAPFPEEFAGIRLGQLREALRTWQDALEHGTQAPPPPCIAVLPILVPGC
jgi:predicted metal-dependent hydrolase